MSKSTIKKLHPSSEKAITLRAKGMLQALKLRGLENTRDIGFALAAAKMVVTVLEAQAEMSQVPTEVLLKAEELSADLDAVIGFLGMSREDIGGSVH